MRHRHYISVPKQLTERAKAFGLDLVRWYAEEGATSPSRSRSGNRGAETDPVRQSIAKVGEIAVALFYDLDPSVIKWEVGDADPGHDIVLHGTLLDVKATETWKQFLVWSIDVNDLYWQKQFDFLIGVSVQDDNWSHCWIEGLITKKEFFERKQIADGQKIGKGLEPGTWFVPKNILRDAATLRPDAINRDSSEPICVRAGISMKKSQWLAVPEHIRKAYWHDTDWGKQPASLAMVEIIRACLNEMSNSR